VRRFGVLIALGTFLLAGGCSEAAAPKNEARAAAPAPAAALTPEAVAQRLVRRQLGEGEVRFGAARVFHDEGFAIVCGSYARGREPEQRFVAVGDIQVWLEPDMAPGEMDRAFAEYCRDGSANA
jgi:hypothetical protein